MRNCLLFILLFFAHLGTAQIFIDGEGENSYFENCTTNFINRSDDIPAEAGYRNNEDYFVTICPSDHDLSKKITIDFSRFELEDGYDFLEIYDDNRTQAVAKGGTVSSQFLLGAYTGTNSPGRIQSTRGCLTFHFTSDGSIVKSGWKATISCNQGGSASSCEAQEIDCGKTYTGNTQYGSNNRNQYECATGTWEGRELVYKIRTTKRGDIKATLTTSTSLDLDIFILEDCASNCVAKNTNGAGTPTSVVRHNNAAAGDYYIVIDGEFSNTYGAFNLIVDCEAENGGGNSDCYNDYIIQDIVDGMCQTSYCNVSLYKATYYGAPAFYKEVTCPELLDAGGVEVLDCNGNSIAYDGFWEQTINYDRLEVQDLIDQCYNASDCLVADDFESYYAGDDISFFNPSIWKKWNNNVPDGKISRDKSFTGSQSLEINRNQYGAQDVVLKLGNRTTGIYKINWQMYINDSDKAYFNIQNNTDDLKQGGELRIEFESTYTSYQNRWFDVELYIDLDNNELKLFLDNRRFEHEQNYYANLGGINFYATADAHFYIDDICMETVQAIPFTDNEDSASSRSKNNQTLTPLVVNTPSKKSAISSDKQEALTVYPNPTKGLTTLNLDLTKEETIEVTIFNQTGQIVKQMGLGKIKSITQSIDFTDLPNGMYILKAQGHSTNLSQKVLVQH